MPRKPLRFSLWVESLDWLFNIWQNLKSSSKLIFSLLLLNRTLMTLLFTSEWDLKSNCSNMPTELSMLTSSLINKIKSSWRLSSIFRRLCCQSLISMVLKNTLPFSNRRFQTHRLKTISFLTQLILSWTCASCMSSCSCWLSGFSVWVISAEHFKTKLREWS